jgi:hypothetical protein
VNVLAHAKTLLGKFNRGNVLLSCDRVIHLLTHFFSSSFYIDLIDNSHYYGAMWSAVAGGNHYAAGISGAPSVHFTPSALEGIIGKVASGLNNLVNREAVNYGKIIDELNTSLLGTPLNLRKSLYGTAPTVPPPHHKRNKFLSREEAEELVGMVIDDLDDEADEDILSVSFNWQHQTY